MLEPEDARYRVKHMNKKLTQEELDRKPVTTSFEAGALSGTIDNVEVFMKKREGFIKINGEYFLGVQKISIDFDGTSPPRITVTFIPGTAP